MALFYVLFSVLSLLATGGIILTKLHKNQNPKIEKIVKILTIVYMCLYFVNLFLPDSFAMRTFDDVSPYAGGKDIWFALLRWFNDVSLIVIPVAVFFKKKVFFKIATYFCLIVCVLNVSVYFKYIAVYTSTAGAGIMALRFFNESTKAFFINTTFRSLYFGLTMFIELILLVFITLKNLDCYKVNKDRKSVLQNFAVFFLILFSIIPIYVPQYLFCGYAPNGIKSFSTFKIGTFFHFAWIAFVIAEGVVLTKVFKKKDYDTRFIVVLTLAISLLMQYNQMFTGIGEITAHRMPFQLCNMAGFFIILMLLTKNERIYHFTLVINAVGAIIAMAMCDTTPYGVTYIMNVHYIAEHTNVILTPILCATLGIFKPLKNKHIVDFLFGFAIYFLAIMIIGGTFTGLKEATGDNYWNCNYLFMFNKEETASIVGFVAPLFDINFKLFNFFTISIIQLIIFIVFAGICTGAFFALKPLSKIGEKCPDAPTDCTDKVEQGNE